jgi:16S rRNA A1518/A1519 N6-dimethyltransferase RsmA/KsgA/DIM1 with predicted DNA glycosylase/AP lyase activity
MTDYDSIVERWSRSLAKVSGRRSALKSLTPEADALLEAAGVEPTARAEEIDQAGFRRLADAWRRQAT